MKSVKSIRVCITILTMMLLAGIMINLSVSDYDKRIVIISLILHLLTIFGCVLGILYSTKKYKYISGALLIIALFSLVIYYQSGKKVEVKSDIRDREIFPLDHESKNIPKIQKSKK